ncbi:MAG: hypothetical protein AAGA03_02010 [Planctomycetota bacterium]
MNPQQALMLLTQCDGDEIWSLEYCEGAGVPDQWVTELADAVESGFERDAETIYVDNTIVNQYHGIKDVDLALRLGEYLGVDIARIQASAFSRRRVVQAIKEAVMDE